MKRFIRVYGSGSVRHPDFYTEKWFVLWYGISKTFQYFDLQNDLIKKTNEMTF